jgi:succinoglycan biosynthesis protein ExoO
MATPLISVIMAAHNVGSYIEEAVTSVLGQTARALELIVVDDASTDDTAMRLLKLQARNPRLLLLREGVNAGVSAARNHALALAKGTWIAIVDADDRILPARLTRLIDEAEALGADWIADDQYLLRDGARDPIARLMTAEAPGARLVEADHLVHRDPPDFMGYGLLKPVIRRAFLERSGVTYRADLKRYEDFFFLMELAARGARLALLDEPLYVYRLRAGSLTKIDPRRVLDEMLSVSTRARQVARECGDEPLDAALARRETLIARGRRYYNIVMPWKAGARRKALTRLIEDPALWPHLAQKFAAKMGARLIGRDPLAHVLLGGAGSLLPQQKSAPPPRPHKSRSYRSQLVR